jgi:nitrite reductase/ring-hydroxylating ferredoxin subunit
MSETEPKRARAASRSSDPASTTIWPYPTGWYVIARSEELPRGAVLSCHYFGRELVLYRGKDRVARMVDAQCPHLGAHLGRGGKVIGNNLQCPFHHWQFEPSGRCVHVPYAEPQSKARLATWPIVERNGQILAWYCEDGRAAHYDVPGIDAFEAPRRPGWSKLRELVFTYKARVHEVVENVVDRGHFVPVHGVAIVPEIENLRFDAHRASLTHVTRTRILGRMHATKLAFEYHGPTWTHVRIDTSTVVELIASLTPIDAHTLKHRILFRIRKMNPVFDRVLSYMVARQLKHDFVGDIEILSNKVYLEHPMLCRGEGDIMRIRSWLAQFEPARRLQIVAEGGRG